MTSTALEITVEQARRFLLRTQGIATPHACVADALTHHDYVQMDPINVCGRMHDLILRTRVRGYREGDLLRHAYGEDERFTGRAFEHYLPERGVLVMYPIEAWPVLAAVARGRRSRLGYPEELVDPEHVKLAQHVLAEIEKRGPLTSDDFDHDGRTETAWGTQGRLVKKVLEALFDCGRILIAARRGFRRVYDLASRVMPRDVFDAPEVSAEAVARWAVRSRLRQLRLVRLRESELSVVRDLVQPVRVNRGQLLYCLRGDADELTSTRDLETDADRTVHLLAPLDPAIYDRKVTAAIWDFDYTWEVYTPRAKRVRGYYALPVLSGGELVGYIDPKVDREQRRLRVVSRRVRRGHRTAEAVRELAGFLGVRPPR